MQYNKTQLDAKEIEHRLRTYLDELVIQAGGLLTVWRIASLLTSELRAKITAGRNAASLIAYDDAEAILAAVAKAHGLSVAILRGRDRTRPYAIARHHAAWELRRRRPDFALCKIAAWLDRTDHSTIINALRWFNKAVEANRYKTEIDMVEEILSCK